MPDTRSTPPILCAASRGSTRPVIGIGGGRDHLVLVAGGSDAPERLAIGSALLAVLAG